METAFKQFEKTINVLGELDQNGESGFAREFQALRQTSFKYKAKGNTAYATKAGECLSNRAKNRFKDILPFDHTRVTIPPFGDDDSDYINANFIKGVDGEKVYIASQGPLPNTVNDFWRMLWSYKVKVVVMLCREEENGKKKCHRYWCEGDEDNLTFGEIIVKTERTIGVGNDFVMRTLVAESHGEKLTITQFHYTAWPDHGVPTTALPLINLIKLVREYQPEDNPPIIMHCSAGCGRTGTICALDYTRSLLKETKYKELIPYRIVENLRKQRHAMVQTKGQYEFLCRAMLSLFREKLDLPIEEIHDHHLYENVSVPRTQSSDSDSDLIPQSPISIDKTPHPKVMKKKEKPSAAKLEQKIGLPQGGSSQPTRVGQTSQQHPSENYVNVSIDLIDFSADTSKSAGVPKPAVANTRNGISTPDGGRQKVPLSRQASAPDYVIVDRSRNTFDDDHSDYVVAPPRVPAPKPRPPTTNRPAVPTKPNVAPTSTSKYENVDVPPRRSPNHVANSSNDRSGKSPVKAPLRKDLPRSLSSSNDHEYRSALADQKFSTIGSSLGAKYSDQMKALDGRRAKVLPTEDTDQEHNDKVFPNEQDVNSSLYSSVNKSRSCRRPMNENTFKGVDSVDGERAPAVPRKTPELLSIVEPHDQTNESKGTSKSSSLTNKILSLSRRNEVRGTLLDNIGYEKRVPKPKGPRNPPSSWKMKC
ncbi:tyrosine-protein phosphatase non-receptor type 12-like isoform X2 [Dendronephthya gigantea]|uniref:tyrosine-protein phosphatase non-receptor type 12-like isoform X2 n=1 Tax=Dendronephthya gigantea TaxID=151771 RepID=UPI00106B32F5|nr:tyrosine-protein phosphatase non-receptor type 12-like isoform X2 [Dendronephthya gigantea]